METLIEMRGIRKGYTVGEQQVRALDGVDFSVARGEMVAILGPSGSGKSTLMNVLGCLDTPEYGLGVTGTALSSAFRHRGSQNC